MSLPRSNHVLLPREHTTYRSARLLRCQSEDRTELDRSSLLASEPTTHPLDSDNDLVGLDIADLSGVCLPKKGVSRQSVQNRQRETLTLRSDSAYSTKSPFPRPRAW